METFQNVARGMCLALQDAPPIFSAGLENLVAMYELRNSDPLTAVPWSQAYEMLCETGQTRADARGLAHRNASLGRMI